MKKQHKRQIVDAAMMILLPLLMAYSLIGERFHEIAGTAMLLLFLLHHGLNRKWYPARFRRAPAGKLPGETARRRRVAIARRIFQMTLDIILLVIMILQPVSGILLSKHLYTFLRIPGISAPAREIHMCLAYWGFVLMCLHAGTHLTAPLARLQRRKKSLWAGIHLAWLAAAVYGCTAFSRRKLADYMFRKTAFAFFDYAEPKLFFFLDYAAMMLLFLLAGYLLVLGLGRAETGKQGKTN